MQSTRIDTLEGSINQEDKNGRQLNCTLDLLLAVVGDAGEVTGVRDHHDESPWRFGLVTVANRRVHEDLDVERVEEEVAEADVVLGLDPAWHVLDPRHPRLHHHAAVVAGHVEADDPAEGRDGELAGAEGAEVRREAVEGEPRLGAQRRAPRRPVPRRGVQGATAEVQGGGHWLRGRGARAAGGPLGSFASLPVALLLPWHGHGELVIGDARWLETPDGLAVRSDLIFIC